MENLSIIYFENKTESSDFLKTNNFRFYMVEGCDITFVNNTNFKVCLRRYKDGKASIYKR
jgi:hypothetical protein